MISAILFLNARGDVLISRIFRDEITSLTNTANMFKLNVIHSKDVRSPVITLSGNTFLHVRIADVFVVAVTQSNCDVSLVFESLHRFIGVFGSFLGKFNQNAIIGNFVLIYELLDEMFDYGWPQTSGTEVLNLTQVSHDI